MRIFTTVITAFISKIFLYILLLGQPISQGCQAEMRSFAILVFEQYQVSPIIVAKCDSEIKNHCSHLVGKEKDDGAMMDCLMTLAASGNNTMSDHCFTAVRTFL